MLSLSFPDSALIHVLAGSTRIVLALAGLWLALPQCLAAQDGTPGFERVEGPTLGQVRSADGRRPELRLTESDGLALEAHGEQLWRSRSGQRSPLGVTGVETPGTIRDLVSDPAGVTLVAADKGIFLVSPDTEVLTPVELREGTPPGQPLAIHFDARRRLWLVTDRAFGVVNTAFFYGRTFTAADGLPEVPPRGLVVAADGALLLTTAEGTYRYWPDLGPAPTVIVTAVNGVPYAPGQVVSVTYPTPLTLGLAGTGRGGVTFRVVPDERGRYEGGTMTATTATIRRLDPGRRTIAVVALDRDLNVSAPAFVAVDVAWPAYYRPAFVVSLGLAMTVLVLSAALLHVWRRGGESAAYAKAALSALLALVVGLQVVAGLVPHGRAWPFVGYSMYTGRLGPGSVVGTLRVEGLRADGTIQNVGGAFGSYHSQVIHPLTFQGERAGRALVRAYNALHGWPALVGIQVKASRYRLTASGPVRLAPIIRARYIEEESHEAR